MSSTRSRTLDGSFEEATLITPVQILQLLRSFGNPSRVHHTYTSPINFLNNFSIEIETRTYAYYWFSRKKLCVTVAWEFL